VQHDTFSTSQANYFYLATFFSIQMYFVHAGAGRCGRGGRPGVVVNITCGGQERNVPKRFAADLGIKMHAVEAQGGKLKVVVEKVVVEEINTNSITTSDDAVQER